MEHEETDILDDSLHSTEQDQTKVDESEAAMEVTPPDQQVNVVPEAKIVTVASLQETVLATCNQVTSDVEE